MDLPRGMEFPQGSAPGFNSNHLAANGLNPATGFSVVSAGGNLINLLTGKPTTLTGAPTTSIDGKLGRVTSYVSSTISTITGTGGTITGLTYAGFVKYNAIGTYQFISYDSSAVGCTTNLSTPFNWTMYVNGAGDADSGITPVAGVPYFFIMSGISATKVNFLVLNLTTGSIRTSTVATATSFGTMGNAVIGAFSSGTDQMNGSIAALMCSQTYLTIPQMLLWAQSPWDFWYPPSVSLYGLARSPTVSSPAYDTSLPPVFARRNVDLLTGVQTGFKGAPIAPQPQWNYNEQQLLPRGRGPSVDPTSIIPGSHGAAAPGPIEASLPPQGRGPPADQRTWAQAGFQGAAQQRQNDDALPPRGRGPTVDPTWVVSGQVSAALVQPIPAYDTSLPPSRRGLPIDLGTSYQAGSQGAKAQVQNDDARPPLGRGSSVDILTWLVSGSHGAAAQTQNDDSLPPRGRGRAVELTWTVSGSIIAQLAQVPFYDTSLPPLGRRPSLDLGTSYQAGYVSQGVRSQTQNDTELPPRGRGPSVDLTWSVSGQVVVQIAQVPFYDTSLPPLGREAAIDLGTSFQAGFLSYGASAQTQNDDSLPPIGRGPAIDLTWLESQNPGGPPAPPVVPTSVDTHDGVRHRYTASQLAQVTGWLKARRDKRKEEEAKLAAAKVAEIAIAAIDEVEAPVKAPRKPLPLSTKARRKLREALAPPPAPIVALALQTVTVLAPSPSFAERRAQLRAEWEAVLAAHEDAIEQEDEEAVIHLFMHMIGEDRLDG